MRTLLVLSVLSLVGCAGIATKQYAEAHERYLDAIERVTVLEAEVADARASGQSELADLRAEALAAAQAAAKKAEEIRAQTRDDALKEQEIRSAFWGNLALGLTLGIKLLKGYAEKTIGVAT